MHVEDDRRLHDRPRRRSGRAASDREEQREAADDRAGRRREVERDTCPGRRRPWRGQGQRRGLLPARGRPSRGFAAIPGLELGRDARRKAGDGHGRDDIRVGGAPIWYSARLTTTLPPSRQDRRRGIRAEREVGRGGSGSGESGGEREGVHGAEAGRGVVARARREARDPGDRVVPGRDVVEGGRAGRERRGREALAVPYCARPTA